MSLLLSQPTLCVRKPVLVRSSPFVCKASSTQNIPFATLCTDPCRPSLKTFTPLKGNVPLEMLPGTGMMGSSNGWLATLKEDGIMKLQDLFVHQPKCLSLHPIKTLPLCQTQIITNVAMSSSSFGGEDGVYFAVKFLGPQLSFCKLQLNYGWWTDIRIPNPSFFSSPVMFSKKDKMFRMVGSGGHLIGSWDPRGDTSEFQKLQFQNIPELSKNKRELLDSCCTSEHLVESESTGETFLVKWYKKTVTEANNRMETMALMVFKLDDEENAVYTKNIGDLAILLTKSEAFCVPASSIPDMRCNSVKIMDVDETTSVDLAAQKWD